jgi:hypothetical protein
MVVTLQILATAEPAEQTPVEVEAVALGALIQAAPVAAVLLLLDI